MATIITEQDLHRQALEQAAALGLVNPIGIAKHQLGAAPRLAKLQGARGGLLDNTKGNAGPLLTHVGNLLRDRYGVKEVSIHRKLVYSRPADPALLDLLAKNYDFVVTGVGACGSCTSACVRDAVDLEARGIPTVAIHTEVFMNSGAAHALAFGRADFEFVSVRHPIAAIPDAELRERAEEIVDSVARLLTVAER